MTDEDYAQITANDWCSVHKIPFYHVANERKTNIGQGALLKRKGVKRGFPDCFLPRPNDRYHGLFIELKIHPNQLTKEQREFLDDRTAEGYHAVCCTGKTSTELADMAIEVIRSFYLL